MAKLSPVPVERIAETPLLKNQVEASVVGPSKVSAVSTAGPRKLIRPSLLGRGLASRPSTARAHFIPILDREERTVVPAPQPSQVEAFYLRKQVQQQTRMTFVLQNGEQIEGYIEWYDSNAIKVRSSSRMLIYKSSIKYMYKAGEFFRI